MEETKNEVSKTTFKLGKKRIIAIIFIVILIIMVIITFFAISDKEKFNGELGNISNMGLAASGDNAVFYNKYENGIVKVKGLEEFQITDETAYGINVVGDDIYYLSVGDSSNINIKKIKTNGNDLTTIKSVKTSISKIYVLDDYIYYATNEKQDGIAKLTLDGKNETIITASEISDFEVIDGMVYFSNKIGKLFKININGTEYAEIPVDYNIDTFQVKNNYIYYFNEENKNLCRVKNDGTENEVVSEYVNSNIYNITKDKIYFFDQENKMLASINLDGGNYKAIKDISTNKTKINVVNDVIYYLDASVNESKIYQMYRIKTNGSSARAIEY